MDIARHHRVALFNSFSKTYSEFERTLQAELTRRDEEHTEEKSKLEELIAEQNMKLEENQQRPGFDESNSSIQEHVIQEQATRIKRLEAELRQARKENEDLTSQFTLAAKTKEERVLQSRAANLENKENTGVPIVQSVEPPKPAATMPQPRSIQIEIGVQTEPEPDTLTSQYEELAQKHEQLRLQLKHYKTAHSTLADKYRKDKAVWKQWVDTHNVRKEMTDKIRAELKAARAASAKPIDRLGVGQRHAQPITPGASGWDPSNLLPPPFISLGKNEVSPTLANTNTVTPAREREVDFAGPSPIPASRVRNASNDPQVDVNAPTAQVTEPPQIEDPENDGENHKQSAEQYDSDETTDGEGEMRAAAFSPISRAIISDAERSRSPSLPPPLPRKKPITVKTEPGTATHIDDDEPVIIKSEPRSSDSPLDYFVFTQQSLDLDDVGQKLPTPRKQYGSDLAGLRGVRGSTFVQSVGKNHSDDVFGYKGHRKRPYDDDGEQNNILYETPPVPTLAAPRLSGVRMSGIQTDSHYEGSAIVPPSTNFPPRISRQPTISGFFSPKVDSSVGGVRSRAPIVKATAISSEDNHKKADKEPKQVPPHVKATNQAKKPTPSKMKILPRTSNATLSKKAPRNPPGYLDTAQMTEDGTDGADLLQATSKAKARDARTPLKDLRDCNTRLQHLLATPPSRQPSITYLKGDSEIPAPTDHSWKNPRPSALTSRLEELRTPNSSDPSKRKKDPATDPPMSKRARLSTASERKPAPSKRLRSRTPNPSDSTCATPLRSRDPANLDVTDFRINPDKNNGLDYAYKETVRNKDQRRCLPSCSRPCCAGIDKFVLNAGLLNRELHDKAPRWRSSPVDGEEGDEEGAGRGGIDATKELEGTRKFKELFSRHRDAFPSRKTPPGFWESDFPSTQEITKQKEKAEMERVNRVEEMRREAKRGGRYAFRDE